MMRLVGILKRPEGKSLEFRRELSSPDGALKTIIAFANTPGRGKLFLQHRADFCPNLLASSLLGYPGQGPAKLPRQDGATRLAASLGSMRWASPALRPGRPKRIRPPLSRPSSPRSTSTPAERYRADCALLDARPRLAPSAADQRRRKASPPSARPSLSHLDGRCQ